MVQDIVKSFETNLNRDNLSVQIPDVFERLKGKDVKFEMVSSNTCQPLNLFYNHNIVTDSIAFIFVN